MQPKIFILTLKNSPRYKNIIDIYKQYNLDTNIFFGIDGRIEDLSKYNIDIKPKQRFWHNSISCCSYKHKLTKSELGCALSHIKIYEHIVENDVQFSIICEDDIVPANNKFVEFYDNIEDIYKNTNFDIIFLNYIDKLNSPFRKTINKLNLKISQVGMGEKYDWLFNRRKTCYLTSCYVLTLKGAQKLLNKAYPVRMPSDRLTGLIAYNKLNAWKISPFIVRIVENESTVVHYTGN